MSMVGKLKILRAYLLYYIMLLHNRQLFKNAGRGSETFKSKFHCPLMRWNLLLHE